MTFQRHCAVFIIAFVVHLTTAQNSPGAGLRPPTDTAAPGLSPDDIKVLLHQQNEARLAENALAMENLTWSADLAMKAQNWTNGCKFAHQPPRARQWGENIAAVGNTRSKSGQLIAMINEWVGEKKHNKKGTFEECCSFRKSTCCHYTQVIWSDTTKVGCGYTVCDNLDYNQATLTNIAFLACYYTPSGNRPKVTYDWRPYTPADSKTPA